MVAILSLFLVIAISILITRVATIALAHTGLSRESARFQARSAFTGVGFTTAEAEGVVNHPVRRRIVLLLMLLGNAGVVTAISSLLLTFLRPGGGETATVKIVLLVTGVVLLWTLASSHWVDRHLSRVIEWALNRYTRLDVRDYASVMHLGGEYRLSELYVEPQDWLANRPLRDTRLWEEGILVLGIDRANGRYLGTPRGSTTIVPGDTLLVYGRTPAIQELDQRRRDAQGDQEHQAAVAEQAKVSAEEEQADREPVAPVTSQPGPREENAR